MPKYRDLYDRLVSNIHEPENDQSCWVWARAIDRDGYPRINVYELGRTVKRHAHRLMAKLILGREIDPNTETVDHLCRNTACINPGHFEMVTRAENSERRWRPA